MAYKRKTALESNRGRPRKVQTDKSKGGRPLTKIDKKIFENLCAIQATLVEIAGIFDCSEDTIQRFCEREYGKMFSEVWEKYSANGKISLRRMQFKSAEAGNVTMQIWLGKQYLGQKEKQEMEVTEEKDYVFNILPASGKGD